MRILLATIIALSATFGPICPLQMAFAAPETTQDLLMSVASASDLQACVPQPGSTIGRRMPAKSCPTDRCLATAEEEKPSRDLAFAPEHQVNEGASFALLPLPLVPAITEVGRAPLYAFADTLLTVVKRE